MENRPRIFGWLITGALFGAAAGMWLAEVRPVYEFDARSRSEARLKTAERMPTLSIGGAVVGALLGGLGERSLSRRVTVSRLFTILLVIAFLAVISDVMIHGMIRSFRASPGTP